MREWAKILIPLAVVVVPLWITQVSAGTKAQTVEEILAELAPEIQTVRNQRTHWETRAEIFCDEEGQFHDADECQRARDHLTAMGEVE